MAALAGNGIDAVAASPPEPSAPVLTSVLPLIRTPVVRCGDETAAPTPAIRDEAQGGGQAREGTRGRLLL